MTKMMRREATLSACCVQLSLFFVRAFQPPSFEKSFASFFESIGSIRLGTTGVCVRTAQLFLFWFTKKTRCGYCDGLDIFLLKLRQYPPGRRSKSHTLYKV